MLALTAALVAPYFIDWNAYRSAFEREAGRVLGREVRVEGAPRARLLPFPSLTFTDVVVAGEKPGTPAMTVDEFSMDAELAPFLRGEVLIFDMRLVRPRARVAVGDDGSLDWAARPNTRFDPRQIQLEKVTITDGRIELRHGASGRTHMLSNIDAELSARTLAGPWRIDGTLDIDQHATQLTVSTGSIDEAGALRIRMVAQPQAYPVKLESNGEASFSDGVLRYGGIFDLVTLGGAGESLRGSDGETFQLDDSGTSNRISGQFNLDHERLVIDAFRFETGPADAPYRAEGEAMVELGRAPRFFIQAEGAQIRFDAPENEAVSGRMAFDKRLAAFKNLIGKLPTPSIPGEIAVNLPAIVAGDTTIRDIQLRAEPAKRGWNIQSFAATLPGRTRFEGQGLLATGEDLSFTGNILLAIKQPSGFAAWLAKDVDDAIRRLPAAGFSADVELSQNRQRFDNLELILGDARFRGRIDRRAEDDTKPSFGLVLDGGRLDLDGMRAFAALFVSDDGVNRLSGHDVDLEVKAGPFAAMEMTAETLDTALRLRDGELEIDRLTLGGLAGARLSATGQLRDLATAPAGKLDATILAVDLAPLMAMLAERFPQNALIAGIARRATRYPGLLSDAQVNLVASATDDGGGVSSLAVSAQGIAGETEFSLGLSGSGPRVAPETSSFTGTLTAKNEEAAALYGWAGLPVLPLGLAGGAEIELAANGSVDEGIAATIRLSGDALEAGFDGAMAFEGGKPSLGGSVRLDSSDVEPWLALSGIALPGFGLGLPAELTADIEWNEGRAILSKLNGSIVDQDVSGALNVSMREGKPYLSGALHLASLDLASAAEMILGMDAFDREGDGWPQVAFGQKVDAPFWADLDLRADALWAGPWIGALNAAMRLKLDGETIAVSNLDAALYGGKVEGYATLKNNAGTGLFSAQLGLKNAAIDAFLPQGSLSGTMDAHAGVTATGKTMGAMVASLSGSGSAVLREIIIDGLNPQALAPLLAKADEAGNTIEAEQVSAFAPDIIRNGRFEMAQSEFAFTIAGGVARTPPLRLEAGETALMLNASADLRARTVSVDGSIAYDAGLESVVGAEPVARIQTDGPLGLMDTRIDTAPMAQYLTQRALEREQARVEHMQSVLLEKQRLRREIRYYAALSDKREQAAQAERQRFETEARLQQERVEKARQEEASRQEEARKLEAQKREELRKREEAEAAAAARAKSDAARENRERLIERAPLPPPGEGQEQPAENNAAERKAPPKGVNSRDAVSDFFRAKNLSPERLMELLGSEE